LVATGLFFVFTSYASAIGWGTGNMQAFATDANPYYAMGHALWGTGWWVVVLAVINSAIGVGLASTNSASRVMYTMGQAGTLPACFGRIHPVHQTPAFAIAFMQMAGIVSVLLVGFLLKPDYIFGLLETVATLAVILIYCTANLALTAYIRREHPRDFSIWKHLVFPWVATLGLAPVLVVTVFPVPEWPYNIAPWLFMAVMAMGAVHMLWLTLRKPGALERGATMMVGSRSNRDGDVDWDKPAVNLASRL
jgi:amino acid transporter